MSNKKNQRALTADELERGAGRFKMLGEPIRLKIFQAVGRGPRSVNDIVAAAGSTQANVSKHLALLAAAGILQREKNGQCVYYGVKDQLAIKMCELVRAQLAD